MKEYEKILKVSTSQEKIQQQIAQKFLLAQGRGCKWSSLPQSGHHSEGSPQEFIRNGVSRDAPIFGCGCCGFRSIDRPLDSNKGSYQYRNVEDLDALRLEGEELSTHMKRIGDVKFNVHLPVNEGGDTKMFELWKAYSIWPQESSASAYYYLHPEFVETDPNTEEARVRLCRSCCTSLDQGKWMKRMQNEPIPFKMKRDPRRTMLQLTL